MYTTSILTGSVNVDMPCNAQFTNALIIPGAMIHDRLCGRYLILLDLQDTISLC